MKKMKRLCLILLSLIVISIVMTTSFFQPVFALSTSRNNAILKMNEMASIRWRTNSKFYIQNKSTPSYVGCFDVAKTFIGIPYTQMADNTLQQMISKSTYTSSLYYFTNNTSTSTCTWQSKTYTCRNFGNDCSTAVALAWQAAGCSVASSIDTTAMFNAILSSSGSSGMKKVGTYETSGCDTSTSILSKNGLDNMCSKGYSSLQPGDACMYKTSSTDKHAALVISVSINPSNLALSTVTLTDQIGYGDSGSRFINSSTTWRKTVTYTFQQLYDNGYIPLTAQGL